MTTYFKTAPLLMCALLFAAAGAARASLDDVVSCAVELDQDIQPAGVRKKTVLKVTLDAPVPREKRPRPPVNLAIVLDRSGSMEGDKIEKAKEAAIEALRRLNGGDLFSLVIYNHVVETVVPAQSASNMERIEARIRSVRADGNTALFGGVSQGAAELRKHQDDKYVHRLILLSDGLANVGPSTPDDLGRLGTALIKEGISVTTVGAGTDYNEDLMTKLAQKSDGNTYFVEASSDLPGIFASELGDVLNVVAKKVRVIVDCPEGVKPVGILGREGRIRGQQVELFLNQLYGGQEKYVLIEVEIPAGEDGQKLDVAQARVIYDNPLTLKEATAMASVATSFSSKDEDVGASGNAAVQQAWELNRNALAQQEAVKLADEGELDAAVYNLRLSASNLRSRGLENDDEVLLERAEQIDEQAGKLEEEGLTKRGRKSIWTEAIQEIQQQVSGGRARKATR